MRFSQRYRAQALRRVQQFLDAHADAVGTVNSSESRQKLDRAVAAIDPVTEVQGSRMRQGRGETSRRRALEQELLLTQMRPITKLARAKLKDVPNFAALVPVERGLSGRRLVEAARAMGAAAAPLTPEFVASGFPADFLAQLQHAADVVKASLDIRSEFRREQVGATKAIEEHLGEAVTAVQELDAAVTRYLAGSPSLAEEWRVARRAVLKPGVPRGANSGAGQPAASPAPAPTVPAPATVADTVTAVTAPSVSPVQEVPRAA
jgi:hypothetical protein